jgi:hypothetical protein
MLGYAGTDAQSLSRRHRPANPTYLLLSIISWPPRPRSGAKPNQEAARRHGGAVERADHDVRHRRPGGGAALPPGVEGHAVDDHARRVGNGVDRAEVVAVQVMRDADGFAILPDGPRGGDHREVADVVLLLHRAARTGDVLNRLAANVLAGRAPDRKTATHFSGRAPGSVVVVPCGEVSTRLKRWRSGP